MQETGGRGRLTTGGYPKCSVKRAVSELVSVAIIALLSPTKLAGSNCDFSRRRVAKLFRVGKDGLKCGSVVGWLFDA